MHSRHLPRAFTGSTPKYVLAIRYPYRYSEIPIQKAEQMPTNIVSTLASSQLLEADVLRRVCEPYTNYRAIVGGDHYQRLLLSCRPK